MAIATFDTLKFAKMLKAAGVPDRQAEGQAEAFSEIIRINFQELVTKDDLSREIADLRKDIKHDLTSFDGKFAAQFERSRGEQILVRWMFGLVISLCIALFIRLMFFPGPH